MQLYPFPQNKWTKGLTALFLLTLLYLCRDTLTTTAILGVHKAQFLTLGLLCAAGVVFLICNRRNLKQIFLNKRLAVAAVFALIILLPMLVKRDWQMMYLSVLLCLLTAVFFSYFITLEELAKYYVLMMTGLGVYSIIAMWVLRPLLIDTGLLTVPVFANSLDFPFFNFGLSFVSDWYVRTRNFGLFREPGVYQYFLILALLLNNYTVTWKKERTWWICNIALAITMLTTLATGGIAELGLLALVVFIDRKLYKSRRIWALILLCFVALCALVIWVVMDGGELYEEMYYMVIGKFQPGADSSSERMDAIVTDLAIFLEHPLFGDKLATVLFAVVNNTTSTMIMLSGFGIFGGLLHIVVWMALIWDRERKLWVNLLLIPVMFISFNTQNLITDLFFWLFPCMALIQRLVPRLNKKV